MRLKHGYLALCILGMLLPYLAFWPFLRQHGLDLELFLRQLFATPVSGFFVMDVLVSTLVVWVLVLADGSRAGIRHRWAPLLASLTVGVSLALPLYLYLRETTGKSLSASAR
jgi:hypothetical protein